ncbi:PEP-CTERM sorting domain-containing protein [Thalassotalea sp. SU-HH00458]|uniref:PEP-CTERM sorting domain-containing protein n=1 Tax=Thalassotalea sp. SU-HH00458 TaxID=3127657 RepID=UPI0031089EF8
MKKLITIMLTLILSTQVHASLLISDSTWNNPYPFEDDTAVFNNNTIVFNSWNGMLSSDSTFDLSNVESLSFDLNKPLDSEFNFDMLAVGFFGTEGSIFEFTNDLLFGSELFSLDGLTVNIDLSEVVGDFFIDFRFETLGFESPFELSNFAFTSFGLDKDPSVPPTTDVPEPATIAVFALALCLLSSRRKLLN